MTLSSSQEQREFSRSEVAIRSEVRLQSGILLEGQIRDVSLNGAWFSTERSLPIGHPVQVSLVLSGGEPAEEIRIDLRGQVVRIEEGGVAVEFLSVSDEGIDHLRRLVLYNAQDSEQVLQEFESHVGLRRR